MEDKERREEDFSLDDIMQEFRKPEDQTQEETEELTAADPAEDELLAPEGSEEDTSSEESEQQAPTMSGDTVRLDLPELLHGAANDAQHIDDEDEPEEIPLPQEETPAFTEGWEPEYEQPMGEYVPPKPIAFPTRAESRDMKRKLVIGPEKKYYELTEKGLGKLQLGMFFCLLVVILSAVSTVAHAQGWIPENRVRLMIFSQFLAVLVSGLLGSSQLIQGVADLFKGRFTLDTLLAVTFLVCCADGVFCLLQVRIPCCAAFSLEVLMSLWSTYNRRHAELGQMDVLRKAGRLCGVYARENAWEDKKVLVRIPGEVDDFMDNYGDVSEPEKRQGRYALIALGVSLLIGVFAGVTRDLYTGIQMAAVSLLAAVPATAFIATTRPFAILQRRLHRLGAVLCGWQGVKQFCGKVVFPLYGEDIFPQGTMRMNGVKFFGSRPTDMVLAYAAAVVMAEGSGLAPLFKQVLDSRNGRYYDAENLRRYENGGVGGNVLDEPVLVGPLSFLEQMGVDVPDGIQVSQAVCVAIDGELCGVFAISYEKTRAATAGLSTLSSYRKLNPVMIANEFMMSESFIRTKFGIKSKRLLFPEEQTRMALRMIEAEESAQAALLTTTVGLAPMAFCVTGARSLQLSCNLGVILHMIGGILGMAVVLVLLLLGADHLLIPANMFLYQLVWMIPGFLLTEWTRSV